MVTYHDSASRHLRSTGLNKLASDTLSETLPTTLIFEDDLFNDIELCKCTTDLE